jgi:hypothetical protein
MMEAVSLSEMFLYTRCHARKTYYFPSSYGLFFCIENHYNFVLYSSCVACVVLRYLFLKPINQSL